MVGVSLLIVQLVDQCVQTSYYNAQQPYITSCSYDKHDAIMVKITSALVALCNQDYWYPHEFTN